MKEVIQEAQLDLRKFMNKKDIREKTASPDFIQLKHASEYPFFLDAKEPILITGMIGAGAFIYAHQLLKQQLDKGCFVLNSTNIRWRSNRIPDGHPRSSNYLEFIDSCAISDHRPSECDDALVLLGENSDAHLLNFKSKLRESVSELIKGAQSLDEVVDRLIKNGSIVIELIELKQGDAISKDHRTRKIFLSHEANENFQEIKNRIHMRDSSDHMYAYGLIDTAFWELHNRPIGNGYIVTEHGEEFSKLYYHLT